MWAGTLSLTGIVRQQATPLAGWFPRWFIFYPVVGQVSFIVYLITTIAETNRAAVRHSRSGIGTHGRVSTPNTAE